MEILREHSVREPIESLTHITDRDSLIEIQNYLGSVRVSDEILKYMVALCEGTRNNPLIELGVSPRGMLALARMTRACAILNERNYVVPADVASVFVDVCGHRIILRPRAKLDGYTAETVLKDILKNTPAPSAGK